MGAAVDAEDKNKMSALKFADRKGNSDIVKLLEKCADLKNVKPKQAQKKPVINAQARIRKKKTEKPVKRDYPKPWKISEKPVKPGGDKQEPQLTVSNTPKLEKERKKQHIEEGTKKIISKIINWRKKNSNVQEHSRLNPLCTNKKSGGCKMNIIKPSHAGKQKIVKKGVEDKTMNEMKQTQQRQSEKTDANLFLKITNFDLLGKSKTNDDIFRREESATDSFRRVESDDDTLSREESDGEFSREYANIDVYRPDKLNQFTPACFKKAQNMIKKEKLSERPKFKNY